jgi:phage gp29-like protein
MNVTHRQQINRAREYYNPLRGLDIPRLVRLLDEGERGQYADLQKLYRVMEKRYYVLLALKARRLSALKKLNWSIKIPDELPPGITEAQAKAQADHLRAAYERIVNLPQAVAHLALASFRGYSHLEKHDGPEGVTRLEPVPHEHFFRDQQSWEWRYDPTARNQVSGSTRLADAGFITREVDAPLDEIAVLCGLRANMSKKDWDAFCEDYSIPSVFFALSENTPQDKVKEWLAAAEKVTGNSRGALPPGGTVTTIDESGDGAQFKEHMLWQEREVVLAGTGGLLTMIAESGSGTLAGGAHQDAFDLLALAEALEVSAILQEQFDAPTLRRDFPSQPPVAYFELAAEDAEDLDQLAERLAKLKAAGFDADEEEVSEKFGLKLTKTAPAVAPGFPPATSGSALSAPAGAGNFIGGYKGNGNAEAADPLTNRADASAENAALLKARAAVKVAAAQQKDFEPLLRRLAQIEAMSDPAAQRAALERFQAALPVLAKSILKSSTEEALARSDAMAAAAVSGLAEAAQAKDAKESKMPKTAPSARTQAGETRIRPV